ncbi:hypothetical protein ACFQPG_04915 [Sphingomonas sp. GCM10030256]|uniref:hypothetical protein n=1 Tax=Sphingomonas sp. GCM10030256 TaxID=3273427 RepID=UPI00360A1E76
MTANNLCVNDEEIAGQPTNVAQTIGHAQQSHFLHLGTAVNVGSRPSLPPQIIQDAVA